MNFLLVPEEIVAVKESAGREQMEECLNQINNHIPQINATDTYLIAKKTSTKRGAFAIRAALNRSEEAKRTVGVLVWKNVNQHK